MRLVRLGARKGRLLDLKTRRPVSIDISPPAISIAFCASLTPKPRLIFPPRKYQSSYWARICDISSQNSPTGEEANKRKWSGVEWKVTRTKSGRKKGGITSGPKA